MIAIRAAFVLWLSFVTALSVIGSSPVSAAPASSSVNGTDVVTVDRPVLEFRLAQATEREPDGPRQLGAVPTSIQVPALKCLSVDDAETVLRQRRLRLGQIHRRPSDACPNGGVVAQSPPRGTTVRPGTTVEVIVAATSPGFDSADGPVIPDLEGLTPAEAQSLLRRGGFEIGQISRESAAAPLGTIVRQVPAAGTPSTVGTRVNITVAAEVRVPDLRRLTQAEAAERLRQSSLVLGRVGEESSPQPDGTVIKQWPLPGVPAAANDKVDITIAKGQSVPNLNALTLDAARAEIREAGLQVGRITSRPSDEASGTIIDQRPAANANVLPGSTIDVVLASASVVPDLKGRTLDEAKRALASQLLTVGTVTSKISPQPQGTILEQRPGPDTEISPRSAVNVVLADGFEAPKLVGLSLDEAGAELAKQLMRLGKIEREVTADGDGKIIRQTPAAGASVAIGVAIDVAVRVPPIVPDLLGLKADVATARLAEQKLTLSDIAYQLGPEALEQSVIRQDPQPGTTIENGGTVNIVLAVTVPPPNRPDLVPVPTLSNQTVTQADQNLKQAGLQLQLDGAPAVDRPHKITTQTPEPGRFVKIGTQVTAFVEPIDKVLVPDLFGIDETSIDGRLTEAFLVEGERTWTLSTKAEGTVVNQQPSAGTEVAFGIPIDVVLSASSLIPDLSGLTPEEATPILGGQSLQLGGMEEVFSLSWPGTIVAQVPAPDTPAGTDSVVRVKVVGLMGPLTAGGLFLLALASVVWFKTRQSGSAEVAHPSAQPPPVYGIAKSAAPRPAFNRTAKAARPEAPPATGESSYVVEVDTGNQVIQTDAPNLVKPSIRVRGRADPGEQKLAIESS
ncbi:MAG: PASTA domain-containing protein [Geminicoccaceae bacterium]